MLSIPSSCFLITYYVRTYSPQVLDPQFHKLLSNLATQQLLCNRLAEDGLKPIIKALSVNANAGRQVRGLTITCTITYTMAHTLHAPPSSYSLQPATQTDMPIAPLRHTACPWQWVSTTTFVLVLTIWDSAVEDTVVNQNHTRDSELDGLDEESREAGPSLYRRTLSRAFAWGGYEVAA